MDLSKSFENLMEKVAMVNQSEKFGDLMSFYNAQFYNI